jgi:hypothetical protein
LVPGVVAVTLMEMVHDATLPRVTPETLRSAVPKLAPPTQLLVWSELTPRVIPDGNVSLIARLVSDIPFGLLIVIDSVEAPITPAVTVDGLNDILAVGGSSGTAPAGLTNTVDRSAAATMASTAARGGAALEDDRMDVRADPGPRRECHMASLSWDCQFSGPALSPTSAA